MSDQVFDTIDGVLIEPDEDGFHLILSGHDAEYHFNIHAVAAELLRAVDREIRPWWLESEAAREEVFGQLAAFQEARAAYLITDPKHPDHAATMSDLED